MIGQVRGVLLEKQPPQLLLDVQGVGYEIDAPMGTFYQLPEIGSELSLFTHFVVREDAQQLYGFYTREERALFRALLKVNGVGPRLGLTILSSIAPEEFVRNVLNNDTASLVRLPGVGKKTAERLVIEMRDRLSDWYQTPAAGATLPVKETSGSRHSILQDAIAALIALGYKQQEANRMATKVDDGAMGSQELIRYALREAM
ncbi:MAG TPA: Holliday junction branch migration protein RuvA [Gammaproteobacteria bacterium]|jgi:Holliday junction DNA helicase RuvA|nr:Holliday junction branch migration protein RuvA [Gammaproteobacteria bacterium]